MVHITTPAEEFGPFSALLPVPVDVPTGWECPRCRRVWSPQTDECAPCSPERRRELRESYAFSGFPVTPLGNLTPCRPSADGGLCGCNEPDGDPLCAGCPLPRSQHADPASFRPRGEPEPNPRPATPPASLASDPNGVRQVRLAGEWAEIFTGMQARFLDEFRVWVDVEFRPTPADGHAHD